MAIYRFGRCELDNSRHRLLVAGIERHVEPGVFDLLQFLVEKGDAIATRDQLIEQLEVARSLGISHLVTGSFKGNTSVQRINVCLLDSETGNIIWSERYDVHGEDIFAAEEDAVYQIVSALIQGLTAHQCAVARRKPTTNLSAYECLLRGLQIYKWGVVSLDEAKQSLFWFERAIELEPEYARAVAIGMGS